MILNIFTLLATTRNVYYTEKLHVFCHNAVIFFNPALSPPRLKQLPARLSGMDPPTNDAQTWCFSMLMLLRRFWDATCHSYVNGEHGNLARPCFDNFKYIIVK